MAYYFEQVKRFSSHFADYKKDKNSNYFNDFEQVKKINNHFPDFEQLKKSN